MRCVVCSRRRPEMFSHELSPAVRGLYEERKTEAPQALARVRSGSRVLVGSGCAEPERLVAALVDRAPELSDVEVVHLLTFGRSDYVDPGFERSFRHNAFFIGGNVREAVQAGRADYTPIFLHELPDLVRHGRRVDVALLQLSPPDRHGFCSLGIHVDIQRAALESASLVIAEINPNMPRTFGATSVHLSELDAVVEVDTPLLELDVPDEPDEVSVRIGGLVARLIPNGACLQLGIGSIPNAALRFLQDKKELGVHTEMFSDGLLPLIEQGNVTNAHKEVRPGKTVTSFVMGTHTLYDAVHDNPRVSFYASDFVNDPRVISRNDQVCAVNSALQVDLTGQVAADSIGHRFYSGIGGQVDFIRGAAMSRGGRPIIALPSTAKGGSISRIVPQLAEGAGVVTSRGDVHFVVTEYGVAHLHGKTIRERALALISVAHPDFRQELINDVVRRHYVAADEQVIAQARDPYPVDWEQARSFGDREYLVRPLKASDERRLQELFYRHRPETVYSRYFAAKREMGHREAAELCCVDWRDRMAFGIFEVDGERSLVAVGRYEFDPREGLADIALTVHEDHRRLGMARYLYGRLEAYARAQGFKGLRGEVLPDNRAVIELHRSLGHQLSWTGQGGPVAWEVRF
ncbi:MAG: GNAT family N-acetyltransferase [Myxococcota bacterium]